MTDRLADGSADGAARPSSDVAFTPAVKAFQEVRGSRQHYVDKKEGARLLVAGPLSHIGVVPRAS